MRYDPISVFQQQCLLRGYPTATQYRTKALFRRDRIDHKNKRRTDAAKVLHFSYSTKLLAKKNLKKSLRIHFICSTNALSYVFFKNNVQ